jgi:hypothetical protein
VGLNRPTNVSANNCGADGITAYRRRGEDITANGNVLAGIHLAFGARAGFNLTRVTATGNAAYGVDAPGMRIKDSTVTGNGEGIGGADLFSKRRPVLVDVACDRSIGPFGESLGVCALD